MESPPGRKDYSDVKLPANTPNVFTHEESAVAEHVWENHHPIDWEETTMLDHGRGQELLVFLHKFL